MFFVRKNFFCLIQRRTSWTLGDWREAKTTAARIHEARECVGDEACHKGTRNARSTGEDNRKQGIIHYVLCKHINDVCHVINATLNGADTALAHFQVSVWG